MTGDMLREIYYEIIKLGSQKKNYIPVAGYFLFILLCLIGVSTSTKTIFQIVAEAISFQLKGDDFYKYLDGLFFSRLALIPVFIILMPIVMATLGGDCIAGEMQDGTLKLCMARPRSRTSMIIVKFITIYLCGLIYSVLFAVGGVVIGCLFYGLAPAQVMVLPGRYFGYTVTLTSNFSALLRYFFAAGYFSFSLMTLGAMALFFSTVFNRMSAATITVITVYFVSYIIGTLPFTEVLKPWLISEIMNNAFLFWLTPFPVGKLLVNLATLAIYITAFLLGSIVQFNCKDIK